MNARQLINAVLLGTPIALWTLQVSAQVKNPPRNLQPLEALEVYSYSELSAPALDGTQSAIDVSVASVYVPITPCRIGDTRRWPDGGGGTFKNPFGGNGLQGQDGETMGFWGWAGPFCEFDDGSPSGNPLPVGERCYESFGGSATTCGIPSNATAVHVNFSVTSPQGKGYLRVWPYGVEEPGATLFAWNPGFSQTNAGTISICSDGTTGGDFLNECEIIIDNESSIIDFYVKIYSEQPENIVIDAFGYYRPL